MAGGAGHAAVRQRRPVRGSGGRRCIRSTSSPATTASRSETWSPTTTSTTKPTAKTTATARRQLQLELRRRRADRRSGSAGDCGSARSEPAGHAAAFAGRADAAGRRRIPAHAEAATTTPGARTTNVSWVDWTGSRPQRRLPPLRANAASPCANRHPRCDGAISSAAAGPDGQLTPRRHLARRRAAPTRFLPDQPHPGLRPRRQPNWPGTRSRFLRRLQRLDQPVDFHIPQSPTGRTWRRVIDTALPSPQDIVGLDEGPLVAFNVPCRVECMHYRAHFKGGRVRWPAFATIFNMAETAA